MSICIAHHREHASNALATASRTSALISVKLVIQPDTSPTLQDHGYGLVYHVKCLFTLLSLGTHGRIVPPLDYLCPGVGSLNRSADLQNSRGNVGLDPVSASHISHSRLKRCMDTTVCKSVTRAVSATAELLVYALQPFHLTVRPSVRPLVQL